ncbi:MAG TPA: DCC1-like thiol-disulfide oxidoreductase family protein [Kofleriaceae bacterium]
MQPVLLYDGTCGLCSASVRWILAHERDHELRFAPLQGETAAELRTRHAEIPTELDSVVLVDDDDHVYVRSKTFLHVARHLRGPWRVGYYVRWFPAFLLDVFYRLIARIRYRIWGRVDACELPSPENRARFLP